MLSPREADLVRSRGYCFNHAITLMATTEGEPFVRDGFVLYWDGRRVLLSGESLDEDTNKVEPKVRDLVRWCLTEWPVETLWYVGPERLSLAGMCSREFRCMKIIPPTALDTELVVDCRNEVVSRRLRRWLRSESRRAFEIRRTRILLFAADHFRLLDKFFSGKERTEFLLNLVLQMSAFAANGAGEWFEAWHKGRLAGLAMATDSFFDMDMAVFVCSDRTIPGVGDVLHASMIDASREKGKRFLNLGPSLTEGHARFKGKWGGKPRGSPPWWQQWGRGELAKRQYDGWPARLLDLGK